MTTKRKSSAKRAVRFKPGRELLKRAGNKPAKKKARFKPGKKLGATRKPPTRATLRLRYL
jgi:nucleoid DNA-binding protein